MYFFLWSKNSFQQKYSLKLINFIYIFFFCKNSSKLQLQCSLSVLGCLGCWLQMAFASVSWSLCHWSLAVLLVRDVTAAQSVWSVLMFHEAPKNMQLARLAWIVAIATHPQDCYLDKGHAGETSGCHDEYPCLPTPPPSLFPHCLKLSSDLLFHDHHNSH